MKSNIRKNSEPKPLSEGFSEENDRKNQAPMPNEDEQDLVAYNQAMEEHLKNPVVYSHADVCKILDKE